MAKFTTLTGIAAPLMRINIDTDQIIRGTNLMKVSKEGYGDDLFAEWRYIYHGDAREENPDFVLNHPAYRDAVILLAGHNFACGSSREAAVWAVKGFGFRCVIAPSFGTIFYYNCFKNGLLPVVLPGDQVEALARVVEESDGKVELTVSLETRTVEAPGVGPYSFTLAENYRQVLLGGIDAIEATLQFEPEIAAYQERDRKQRPWVYAVEGVGKE